MKLTRIAFPFVLLFLALSILAFNPVIDIDPSKPKELEKAGVKVSWFKWKNTAEKVSRYNFSIDIDTSTLTDGTKLCATIEIRKNEEPAMKMDYWSDQYKDKKMHINIELAENYLDSAILRIQKYAGTDGYDNAVGGFTLNLKTASQVSALNSFIKAEPLKETKRK